MSTNTVTRPAKPPKLTANQLDLVRGGIIIVSGLVDRSSISTLSFSGTNTVRSCQGI
jgi:hypothetical protein